MNARQAHHWVALALFLLLPASALANQPQAITLPPSTSEKVVLSIHGEDGKVHDFTIAQIEALGTYRLTTKTFWPSDDGTYEGVLLSDLLKKVGMHGQKKLLIKAIDDYAVTIPREDWTRWPVLLATRRDGKLLSLRNKGPTRLIFPMALDEKLAVRSMGSHWAWMIKSFEVPE